ncbi:MAG: alpha-amylase family protein [Candidatus Promineifilaceae bacterium]|nr:alpha-amylase family protein [Candidatus Promineifilaceae bacterium]
MNIDPKLLAPLLQGPLNSLEKFEQDIFCSRLELFLADIERPLHRLYGHLPDYQEWLQKFLHIVAQRYASRSESLRRLDLQRLSEPDWFQNSRMVGYVCYAERFGGTLDGVASKIDYLKELGITYLHLMPLLKPRPGANDGGYAVMDYRQVREDLGTIDDLAKLAAQLRQNGISLCIDLVCNHTAKEHEWARKAMSGEEEYQAYYLMFPDRTLPDQYELNLREIFPEFKRGSFTYYEAIERWVWTTFNEFQWDLNYANPAVFGEILAIMLFLANQGVEILRLDAVAFMWKRLGTDCENQPEAHYILQAFRAFSRIAAPGLLLKAEAIVPPPQLVPYLGRGQATNKECEVAYHNVFMVMLWSSLAERKVALMTHALQQMPAIPSRTSWLTYVRCHDDIGWAVTEEDAAAVGLNGYMHRSFLSDFYSGRFPDTFARGATFQFNPVNNDRRISGSCASLAGLETALELEDDHALVLAIGRIRLLHSMILAFGGIPLLYMGDEIGLLNDLTYQDDPDLAGDNRWMHRPFMDWDKVAERQDWLTVSGQIFQNIKQLIRARKLSAALHAEAGSYAIWTNNDHVFGLIRESPRGRILILGNFSEWGQAVSRDRVYEMGFRGRLLELISRQELDEWSDIYLDPYQSMWLQIPSATRWP